MLLFGGGRGLEDLTANDEVHSYNVPTGAVAGASEAVCSLFLCRL